jgi:hypothetical protein
MSIPGFLDSVPALQAEVGNLFLARATLGQVHHFYTGLVDTVPNTELIALLRRHLLVRRSWQRWCQNVAVAWSKRQRRW